MANVLGELFGGIADAIREKNGTAEIMKPVDFPAKIRGIEGGAAELKWVTFKSYNGSVEYGKKPVAVGDDCADPIVRGIFSTPTREATAQYTYTFAGWARTADGALDSTALEAVTHDRTVYANFIAAVRYYTVTYYDDDGVTVLKTESLAYGSMPEFVPTKVGYTFDGWTTEITLVTEDVSYYANPWLEKLDFSALTWAQISNYCKTSDVSKLFSIGQQKTFSFTYSSSSTVTATAEIVDFYHDDLADGSGKAPITLRLLDCWKQNHSWNSTGTEARETATWDTSEIRSILNKYGAGYTVNRVNYGPERELINVTKTVAKTYRAFDGSYGTTEDVWFAPSLAELGFAVENAQEGTCYAPYAPGKSLNQAYTDIQYISLDGTINGYWTRTKLYRGQAYGIDVNGKAESVDHGYSSKARPIQIFVCIG